MKKEEHVVAWAEEIGEGTHKVVEVKGRKIGIFNVHGRYYALPNACIHQGGPLCEGAISGTVMADVYNGWKRQWVNDGEIVVCPWHTLEFNITTGQCLAFPQHKLPTYAIKVEEGRIKVVL